MIHNKENENEDFDYKHLQIFNVKSFNDNFMSFLQKSKDRKHLPNQYISLLTPNQFTMLARFFVTLNPNNIFPLRLSRHKLAGPKMEEVKNMILRRNSPLMEPFSLALLRIFQTGICEHFGTIQTSIDFSVNPNIRTEAQDWSQIITLAIVKVFFAVMLLSYVFAIFILYLEYLSYTSPNVNNYHNLCLHDQVLQQKIKKRTPLVSISGFALSCFCFLILQRNEKGFHVQYSHGNFLHDSRFNEFPQAGLLKLAKLDFSQAKIFPAISEMIS